MSDREYDKATLKFWTALPVHYGLRLIVAGLIVANCVMLAGVVSGDKRFDSGLVAMLISAVVAVISVNMMTIRLKERLAKLTLNKSD